MIDRRTFLASSLGLAATAVNLAMGEPIKITSKKNKKVKIFATKWGNEQSMDDFCRKAKGEGYEGLEHLLPDTEKEQMEVINACQKNGLEHAFLIIERGKDPANHLAYFRRIASTSAKLNPTYINCHSGRDIFTFEQNLEVIKLINQISKDFNVPLYHETHRQHMLYSGPVSKQYLDADKDFKITLDISHWCTVHESYLEDQDETVEAALKRTGHIHARVGHPQGPQVSDHRAPEWKNALDKHLLWWDRAVAYHQKHSDLPLTITTEYGSLDYMPSLPYSREPLADNWELNVDMLKILKNRYG